MCPQWLGTVKGVHMNEKYVKMGAYTIGAMALMVVAWKLGVEFPKAYKQAKTPHEKLSTLSILI